MSFELDHASLQLADMGQAIRALHERLGLEPLLGIGDPEHHGRIVFENTYVELTVPAQGPPALSSPWTLPWFFLRFSDDPSALCARLRDAGLSPCFQLFEGDDGCWTEIRLDTARETPAPLLLQRPARRSFLTGTLPRPMPSHGCGAFQLAGVLVVTPDLLATLELYRRLLGISPLPKPYLDRVFAGRRVDLRLPSGRLGFLQPEGAGLASRALEAWGPGPLGLQLAVESFWPVEEQTARLGIHTERGITPRGAEMWIDPQETFGVSFGYVEELPPIGAWGGG